MGFFENITTDQRLTLIAKGEKKAKSVDYEIQENGRSLIHFASLHNNLNVFKQCVANGQSAHLKDFNKQDPLEYAFGGHSLDVIEYLQAEYKVGFSGLDCYGYPLWWKALTTKNKSEESVVSILEYLKDKVDFSIKDEYMYKSTIAYILHSDYNFQNLYLLLKHTDYDVNAVAREDHGITLAHAASYMEDSRFIAFVSQENGNKFIVPCYKLLFEKADLYALDMDQRSVIDRLCFSGRKTLIKMLYEVKKIKLTSYQQPLLASCYIDSTKLSYDNEELVACGFEDFIFYKTTRIDSLIVCDKVGLVFGRDDKEIRENDCVTLKELKSMEKIVLNNGYEFFKKECA